MRSGNISRPQDYCSEVPNVNKSGTQIHVQRMREAFCCSIILQFLLFFVFILMSNINIFHPLSWLENCFGTLLTFSVWLKLFALVVVIYIQGEVCKKDYVSGPIYYATRFQKIKHIFNVRNLLLLLFHMLIGVTMFWIYSSVPGSKYEYFTKPCNTEGFNHRQEFCLEEGKLFLTLGGLWLGLYYFVHDYLFGTRNLFFPVIQQYKSYRVKAAFTQCIKHSLKNSLFPTVTFIFLYYVYGGLVRTRLSDFLGKPMYYKTESKPIDSIQGMLSIELLFPLWLFSTIFITAIQIMELLFSVYLTEHNVFPVTVTVLPQGNCMSLLDSLKLSSIPIIHHLGYLDLFNLATKFEKRREEVFTLSHPGGHPHTWNAIFQECSTLIKSFTNDLNKALQQTTMTDSKNKKQPEAKMEMSGFHFHSHNIRKLGSPITNRSATDNNIRSVEHQSAVEIMFNNAQNWLSLKLNNFYKKPYISYFFAESPDSRINYLLCQSQPIIWAVQSLSFISAASLTEDCYGIVQRDLPEIVTIIVHLKQVLDKLFKQNLIVKKSFSSDPLEVQMKYLLRTSVKRSLYKLSITFGPYIKELRLPVDIEMQMNNFIEFKEVL